MIGRRGFIGGIVAAITSGEALIKLADPQEQEFLKRGDPALLPPNLNRHDIPSHMQGKIYIATILEHGVSFEAIGWLSHMQVSMHADSIPMHTFEMVGVQTRHYPGLREKSITFSTMLEHQKGNPWA